MKERFVCSHGPKVLFESILQEAALDFARQYYAKNKVILEISAFVHTPHDHTKPVHH